MRFGYRAAQRLCQVLFSVFSRGRVFGRQHVPLSGGVVLASNHQSFLDPVLAAIALDRECDYMARDTLFRNPLFRRLIETLNAFPVKRGSADLGAVKESLRRLKAGRAIVVFPEGTRTTDGTIAVMREGIISIARKARVPIVPTLIEGAFESWPRHSPLPLPHPIIVAYGPPLTVADLQERPEEELIDEVRARIVALQRKYLPRIGRTRWPGSARSVQPVPRYAAG